MVVSVARSSVPPLSASVTAAVPRALTLPSFRVPEESVTPLAEVLRFALAFVFKVNWPLPCLVIVKSPDSEPRVRFVFVPVSKMLPAAVSVVVPKVAPAVPLVTLLPAVTFNSSPPMERVPRVSVTPAPAVARSISTFAVFEPVTRLVPPTVPPASTPIESLPLVKLKVPAPVSRPVNEPRRIVPDVSVVAAVDRVPAPVFKVNWPAPCLVNVLFVVSEPSVRLVFAAVSKIAPAAESVVVPKVKPAVPLVTLLPAVTFKVALPQWRECPRYV